MSETLVEIARVSLPIEEASGLAFDPVDDALVAVSDSEGRLARAPHDRALDDGSQWSHVALERGTDFDFEGVAVSPGGDEYWLAAERRRLIVRYSRSGAFLGEVAIDIDGRKKNKGLEGLAVNPSGSRVFVVNERKPKIIIELDHELTEISRSKVEGLDDLSGLWFSEHGLWMVSDESRAVALFESRAGGWSEVRRWSLPANAGEGVAVAGDRLFVAFDERLPDGTNLIAYDLAF